MRPLTATLAALITLCSCSLYGADDAPDPTEQCNALAYVNCIAEVACGGGDVAQCAESYADACRRNLTIIPQPVLSTAQRTLAAYACDGTAPAFADELGATLLAVMTAWPESPMGD